MVFEDHISPNRDRGPLQMSPLQRRSTDGGHNVLDLFFSARCRSNADGLGCRQRSPSMGLSGDGGRHPDTGAFRLGRLRGR